MIQIVEVDAQMLDEVEKLVARVFPWRSLDERMSHWASRRQHNPIVRLLMRLYGVSSFVSVWAAVNETGDICGTTGFYTCPQDEAEAIWLSWFCVDPTQRGQGIGGKLMEFSIAEAKRQGKQFLRLYTSDDPNEAAAQELYEKYGLTVVGEEKERTHTTIYRELRL